MEGKRGGRCSGLVQCQRSGAGLGAQPPVVREGSRCLGCLLAAARSFSAHHRRLRALPPSPHTQTHRCSGTMPIHTHHTPQACHLIPTAPHQQISGHPPPHLQTVGRPRQQTLMAPFVPFSLSGLGTRQSLHRHRTQAMSFRCPQQDSVPHGMPCTGWGPVRRPPHGRPGNGTHAARTVPGSFQEPCRVAAPPPTLLRLGVRGAVILVVFPLGRAAPVGHVPAASHGIGVAASQLSGQGPRLPSKTSCSTAVARSRHAPPPLQPRQASWRATSLQWPHACSSGRPA